MKIKNKFQILLTVLALLASSLACQTLLGGGDDPAPSRDEPVESDEPSITDSTEPENPEMEEMEIIRQWAIFALASSEYDNPDWSAFQATGAPESTECEDAPNAWASAESNGVDWLELLYEIPVYPDQINIYQNNLPDQVVEVEVIDPNLNYYTVYTGEPSVTDCPYVLTIDITDLDFLVTGVKITVDQSILDSSWNEIDAVELVGRYSRVDTVVEEPPTSDPTDNESAPSSDYELPSMSPSSLAPGTFSYEVVGDDRDAIIDKGTLQDQSTSSEYVIGFVSADFRYTVSLFIPLDVAPGALNFGEYPRGSFSKGPNAAIFIGSGLYYADGGVIMIESVENDLLTGSFAFVGTWENDDSRKVTVSGVFNQYPLVNK
ncbi:MAG TPA: hypothetical protein VLA72_07920 [Anaerolineales bacterium]|nr:hypothetical protein [Anaerolineales bacterium]